MRTLLALIFLSAALATGARAADAVRPAAVAGSWYPGDAAELGAYLDGQLDAAGKEAGPAGGQVRALIAPHAGYSFSGTVAAQAYRLVRGQRYDRVVLLGPSHRADFHGLATYDVDAFETPLGRVALDRDAARQLRHSPLVQGAPPGPDREHSLEMQLPYLQRALAPGWRLLPLLVGRVEEADYSALAEQLRPLLDDRTLVVVSSDFTHYGPRFGYLPFPPGDAAAASIRQLDMGAFERIEARDPAGFLAYQEETGITVCGFRPIALLLHLLPEGTGVRLIAYDTSGAQQGDYQHSVSYLAVAFTAPTDRAGDTSLEWLHRLAVLGVRRAVEANDAVEGEIDRLLAATPGGLPHAGGRLRDPAQRRQACAAASATSPRSSRPGRRCSTTRRPPQCGTRGSRPCLPGTCRCSRSRSASSLSPLPSPIGRPSSPGETGSSWRRAGAARCSCRKSPPSRAGGVKRP